MNEVMSAMLIHKLNHTQTEKVCNISTNHTIGQSILSKLTVSNGGSSFTNLNPGIYCADINGVEYYFDLYVMVSSVDELHISNANYAYATVNKINYPIILYRKIATNITNNLTLNDTVNDSIDMIIIDGKTTKTLISNEVYNINSISNFKISTSKTSGGEDNYLDILLKNNIKSLPNGVKDTFILNAQQQQHHLIYRIGRMVLSGSEDWEYIDGYSNDNTCLFFAHDNNVKLEDTSTNLNCSHFACKKASSLILPTNKTSGIATSYGTFGNGIFLRVSSSIINDRAKMVKSLSEWLMSNLETNPVIVEYPLSSFRYKTVLLDEYHIQTYYPKTFVSLNEVYDVSYFYKFLHEI